ncbi:solute carrier family 35 member G1 [Culicoides brevitarsis]|uniref:solute carrier family 35 member G1 n=1 Tax=Culicoides brevitarsis TaxID=469753 RepID=UPI00307BBD3A
MPETLELQNLSTTVMSDRQKLHSTTTTTRPPYFGVLLATLSSLFFSLCSVIVKSLTDINPIELAMFRFIGLLPAIPIVLYKQEEVFPNGKRILLLLRSFVGATSLICSFYAFRQMELGDASTILFSTPVFVGIFAKVFLKEPCGYFHIGTIALTILGIIFITMPKTLFGDAEVTVPEQLPSLTTQNSGLKYMFGPITAFCGTLFAANAYVLLRALKGLHYSVIMTNFGLFSICYTLIVSCYFGFCMPKCGTDRLLILLLAIFSFAGQILLTLALQVEQAGPVSIARSSDIVFAFIWQICFFHEMPTVHSLIGALLVSTAVILSGLRKYVMALPDGSETKRRFKFLTIE